MTVTWGAFVPHGAIDEFSGRKAGEAWSQIKDYAQAADDLGYDHIWTSDHLMSSGGDRDGMYFEAYTLLAALSQVTSKARLGQLVTCAPYRNAALLAKEAANVDVFSGGRLILGLGGGWDVPEFEAFGYRFPSARERFQGFAETLEAIHRLWRESKVDFDGEFVRLKGAVCEPKPADATPIWTGTHGPKGLAVAARFADVANFNVNLTQFQRLSRLVEAACEKVGRRIDTSVYRLADLSGGDGLTDLLARLGAPPEAADALKAEHFVGEPEEVVANVQAFVDAGARHIVIMALDSASSTVTTERFIKEVVPEIRDT
jgi:alkanesulfonate monooxygenase SsuD/methylene tetrahydromethanopterin reductase-like flavin-dependent oxidoreductase (luciferase family)